MRRVAALIYDDFQLLDLSGAFTAFEVAGLFGAEGYSVDVLAPRHGLIATTSGVMVQARDYRDADHFDILLVPGGYGLEPVIANGELLAFVRQWAAEGRCIASVCTGAFILAAAGLLEGRRATTHWNEATKLAEQYPNIRVEADALFVNDGNVWTSAGVTAGIDMALALIARDYGQGVARDVARALVVPYRRPGAQSQHSKLIDMVEPEARFANVLAWARMNLFERLDVDTLAAQAGLSPRQFSRAFKRATGTSPAKAIERMRVDSARSAIESGARSIARVAREHGFSDPDRMRRAFLRNLGQCPQALLGQRREAAARNAA